MKESKESAVFDQPFVKKSALIGTASLARHYYEDVKEGTAECKYPQARISFK